MESKKRPSSSGAKSAQKRSKCDPKNIAAPPTKVKLEGAGANRRSVRQPSSAATASSAEDTLLASTSSATDPGNKTIISVSGDSSCDEVFECALQVNPAQAVEMAESRRQKRRANEALLKEVGHRYILA